MYSYTDETYTACLIVPTRKESFYYVGQNPNFFLLLTGYFRSLAERASLPNAAGSRAQMSDGRMAALIGMLRPKCRIASSPADV